MPNRLRLSSTIAVTLLALVPTVVVAQAASRVTVSYESAPLSQVASSFARFSNREITVSTDVGEQLVTGNIQNEDWRIGFDRLLEAQALIARPDSGGVLRVQREQRITVEFQGAPLSQVLRNISTFSKRSITMTSDAGDPSVSFTARSVDWQRALDEILRDNGLVANADANGNLHVARRR